MKTIIFLLTTTFLLAITNCTNKENGDGKNGKTKGEVTSAGFVNGSDASNIIPPEDTNKLTSIMWIDSVKDLGTIPETGLVDMTFRFKNTGKKPLSINAVVPGCGCTQAEKPDHTIAPGEEGIIKAKFNTEGKSGTQTKTISIVSNTNPSGSSVLFKAIVTPKK